MMEHPLDGFHRAAWRDEMNGEHAVGETGQSPAQIAEALALQLTRSSPMPLRPQDEALLNGAETFRFGPDGSRIGWSLGNGPLVALVHGWGGRGTQMAGLAHRLAGSGFRCIFFDAGGHGDSRPEPVGFHTFIHDADALTRAAGEDIHAWIGHSAGGLGMMAARALHGINARRYVCIAAPMFPYVPLNNLKKRLGVSDEVLEHVKPLLAAQFQMDWHALEAGAAYLPESGRRLLLAYDRADDLVDHADAERIAAKWASADIIKTEGYGHNRILQSPEVWERIRSFVAERGGSVTQQR
jgi:pimeloyl-ACP methyl ester carboxylesterase